MLRTLTIIMCCLCIGLVTKAQVNIITVTTTADNGAGSLRNAIILSNNNNGSNRIHFDIPGTGPHVIQLNSTLPKVTANLTIDGTTQNGYSVTTPQVEISGQGIIDTGITALSDSFEMKGLYLYGYKRLAVFCQAEYGFFYNNIISGSFKGILHQGYYRPGFYTPIKKAIYQGNKFGTNPTGNAAVSYYDSTGFIRQSTGLDIRGVDTVIIGGNRLLNEHNLFSNYGTYSLAILSCGYTEIYGNLIGTTIDGDQLILPNSPMGVGLYYDTDRYFPVSHDSSYANIGSPQPGFDNVFSGCFMGLYLSPDNYGATHVYGNKIGTDISGTVALGNIGNGLLINGNFDPLYIGDTGPGMSNIISGNLGGGILFNSQYGEEVTISGNMIGVDITGRKALPNGEHGIFFSDENNRCSIGNGNIIGANAGHGIMLLGAKNISITGSYIGTNPYGDALGNGGDGIHMINVDPDAYLGKSGVPTTNNTIGGPTLDDANIIAHNQGDGIYLLGNNQPTSVSSSIPSHTNFNPILVNRIYDHPNGKSINLNYEIVHHIYMPGNGNKQIPVIDSVQVDGHTFTVYGHAYFHYKGDKVLLYESNSNVAEARQYIGSATVDTNAQWQVTAQTVFDIEALTASLTDAAGRNAPNLENSSGLSLPFYVGLSPACNVSLGADTTMCPGWGAKLSATQGFSSYQWSEGGSTNEVLPVGQPGLYAVTVTDNTGCMVSDTVLVALNNPLEIQPVVSDSLCYGNTADISVDIFDGQAPYTYQWSTGDTTPSASDLGAGSYSLTLTDARYCTQQQTIEVIIPSELHVTLQNDTALCFGEALTTTPVVNGGSAPYTFAWSNGDTSGSNATLLAGDSYDLTLTDAHGCSAVDDIDLLLLPRPAAYIVQSNDTLFANTGLTYQWYMDGLEIPGAEQAFYIPVENGSYTVLVTGSNGCTSISQEYRFVETGLQKLSGVSLQLYPNPTSDRLYANWDAHKDITLQVMDGTGKLLQERNVLGNQAVINVSHYPAGIYLLKLVIDDRVAYKKWVKQ